MLFKVKNGKGLNAEWRRNTHAESNNLILFLYSHYYYYLIIIFRHKKKDKGANSEKELRGSVEYENGCGNEELKFLNAVLMSINDEVSLLDLQKLLEVRQDISHIKRILDQANKYSIFREAKQMEDKQKQQKFLEILDGYKVTKLTAQCSRYLTLMCFYRLLITSEE